MIIQSYRKCFVYFGNVLTISVIPLFCKELPMKVCEHFTMNRVLSKKHRLYGFMKCKPNGRRK